MEDRQLEAKESFELINRMIENTHRRMERNAGRPFLIWGYTTVVFTLLIVGLVSYFEDGRWNWLWFAMPITGGVLMWLARPKNTEGTVSTFVDRVVNHIWIVIGLTAWFMSMLSISSFLRAPILFVVVLMMGIGTTITSLVIRFTPGVVGGIVGIVIAAALLGVVGIWQVALFAAAFVAMMIIPGHILNYRSNHPRKSA